MQWRKAVGIAAAFLVPFAVQAQAGAGAAGGASNQGARQIAGNAGTFAAGTINGTVEHVNLGEGTVSVKQGKRTVTLNAIPGEISQLNPGDVVALNYANFNGALWIQPAQGQQGLGNVPFTNEGRVTGAINSMGRAKGTLTVRGSTFRIHPMQLQGLLPGQFVSVTYADIGGVNWVAAIQPAQGAPNAGQAAHTAGGAQPGTGMNNAGAGAQGGAGAHGGANNNQGNNK